MLLFNFEAIEVSILAVKKTFWGRGDFRPAVVKLKKEVQIYELPFSSRVTGLGLEPRTHALKGRCSTN